MSHILIDARQYSTSTGRYIFRLLQYLEKVDTVHNYTVLLKPEDLSKYQPISQQFTKIATPHKEYTFAEQLKLNRQIKALKPDLVHFGMTQQPLLYRRRKVTTIHDLTTARFNNPDKQPQVFWIKQQIYKFVIKRVARDSQAVITPTNFVKQDVLNFTRVKPNKVTVTLEAADQINDAPQPLPNLAGKQFIMYLGRPTPHKNLERLIEAFTSLQSKHPDLQLVLAGKIDKNYQRIQQKTHNEQIANIVFTDFITEGQLRWLYENCQAYVFPSLSEGFGLPGLEAMMHGAPVVSSNASCLPEVYGPAAHYFDPLNVPAMAAAIDEVLTNKQLSHSLIQAGYQQAGLYSWQRMAEQTLKVYNQALQN